LKSFVIGLAKIRSHFTSSVSYSYVYS